MVERLANNPIITPEMITPSYNDFKVISTINAAATEYNKETLLLLRIAEQPDFEKLYNQNKIKNKDTNKVFISIFDLKEKRFKVLNFDRSDPELSLLDTRGISYKGKIYLSSISHLRVATSKDGINFEISKVPDIMPENVYEEYGIEDPRITRINKDGDNIFLITYTSVSRFGITVSLIETQDFKNFIRHGVILPPDNKDVTIFPAIINNNYYMLHRPMKSAFYPPSIWIAKSKDLKHWGDHKFLIGPQKGNFDCQRIGSGDTPILIDEGWLTIYHGVDKNGKYHLAALLLDKNNPEIVLKRSKKPILSPEMNYEINGFYKNVVFTCGSIKKGNTLFVYYGAADRSLCLAKISIDEIFSAF